MKRSTPHIFYVSPSDFALAERGLKIASSRFGDRTEMWPTGHELDLVDNEDETRRRRIRIMGHDLKPGLSKVTAMDALYIGHYSQAEHHRDYLAIYHALTTDGEDQLDVVYFRIID